jgi:phosphate transport system permease protein
VTLPTSRSGLTTAVILGTARGIGETSPVLLTAGATTFFNFNPFVGAMTSLPLTTFSFVKSPELNFIARGFGTAAVLMVLVVILFLAARAIGGRGPGQLSPRQQRARANGSRDDDYRFRAKELGVTRSGALATATPSPAPPSPASAATDVAGEPAASRSLVSRITAPVAGLRRRLSGRASTPTPPPESPPLPQKD